VDDDDVDDDVHIIVKNWNPELMAMWMMMMWMMMCILLLKTEIRN